MTIKSAEWATYKQQFNNKQMAAYLPRLVPGLRRPGRLHGRLRADRRLRRRGHLLLQQDLGRPLREGSRTPPTPRSAARLFEQVQKIWTDDVPCVPIFQGNLYVFTKKNVTGVKIGPPLIFNYDQLYFTK